MFLCGAQSAIDLPEVRGGSCCWGAVMNGPNGCYCWEPQYGDQVQAEPQPAPIATRKTPCVDCAYRGGSPEKRGEKGYSGDADALEELAAMGEPFFCLGAETCVLTAAGYLPIGQITEGMLVLTHLGRWRPITAVMQRDAPVTVRVRVQGAPEIICTPEHPFLVRRHAEDCDSWVEAGQLAVGSLVAQVIPPLAVAPMQPLNGSATDFYWLIGRYLADGHRARCNGLGRVVISCSHAEADGVAERIARVVPASPTRRRTTTTFAITRTRFHDWLGQFGYLAAGKRVPGWVFSLAPEMTEALLLGYLTGDGCRQDNSRDHGWNATTVSRALVLSMALLAQRRGVVASVYEHAVHPKTVIEGRLVNQQKQYRLRVPDKNRWQAFVDGNYGWKPIRRIDAGPENVPVFNLAVAEDESFVADGCVVHNCHQGIRRSITMRHPDGIDVPSHPANYDPPIVDRVPFKLDGTPADLCAGWAARKRWYDQQPCDGIE